MSQPVNVALLPGNPRPVFMRWIKFTIKTSDAAAPLHSFQCAVTNAGITSTGGDAVSINTLCPDGAYSEVAERTYAFTLTGVQDVETQDSLMLFLMEHDGEVAELTFFPKTDKNGTPMGRGWKGTVTLAPPDTIGGADAGTYATFTATLAYQGRPTMIDSNGVEVLPPPPTGVTAGSPGAFIPPNSIPADLAALQALGALGQTTAWTPAQYVILLDSSQATWAGTVPAWMKYAIKGQVVPNDVFPTEPTITASDATNAAKLAPLGYIAASGSTAWTAGQKFTVNNFDFNWSGTAWAAGAHA